MEDLLLILIISLLNIMCFFIGAKIGQYTVKGKDIKLPNPVQAIEEHKETKKQREEEDRKQKILKNIDNYNGTPLGQVKI